MAPNPIILFTVLATCALKGYGSLTLDALRCGAAPHRTAPHVDAFTSDTLLHVLHCIVVP